MYNIKSFDLDGVINLDEYGLGLRPTNDDDIIITGRSEEEREETELFLKKYNILNKVYYNPLSFSDKTRESSGEHKSRVINTLLEHGTRVVIHYDDDPIQADIIAESTETKVIRLNHNNMIELENIKRD